jgi:hypothetical protein
MHFLDFAHEALQRSHRHKATNTVHVRNRCAVAARRDTRVGKHEAKALICGNSARAARLQGHKQHVVLVLAHTVERRALIHDALQLLQRHRGEERVRVTAVCARVRRGGRIQTL